MILRVLIIVVVMFAIYRAGIWGIRTFGNIPPEPSPPGELRRIKVQYRCAVCGAEARMIRADSETPEPPRHCMEEMELVETDDI
ncbi:MAG: hypothetical protein QOF21_3268 [Actinomycetota bacterium]